MKAQGEILMLELRTVSSEPECLKVAVDGEITHHSIPEATVDLFADLGDGKQIYSTAVALSLQDVGFIDSSGIGWLLNHNKRFREGGGKLVIHSIQPNVENVFRLLNLDQVLHLAADQDDATKLIIQEK